MKYLTKEICARAADRTREVDAIIARLPEAVAYAPEHFHRFLLGLEDARRAVAALDAALRDGIEEYHRMRTETWLD